MSAGQERALSRRTLFCFVGANTAFALAWTWLALLEWRGDGQDWAWRFFVGAAFFTLALVWLRRGLRAPRLAEPQQLESQPG